MRQPGGQQQRQQGLASLLTMADNVIANTDCYQRASVHRFRKPS